jgi:hypothetical protein
MSETDTEFDPVEDPTDPAVNFPEQKPSGRMKISVVPGNNDSEDDSPTEAGEGKDWSRGHSADVRGKEPEV